MAASGRVNIGILGTATIARKLVAAMNRTETAVPVAIASRSLSKAQAFAKDFNIPCAYGSYEELLKDPRVEAVYIPLPTAMHKEWTVKAAEAKKHVLCEKPLATSVEEARAMVAACETHGVLLMDGVMWVHHLRTNMVKEEVTRLGGAVALQVNFSWPGHLDVSNIRLQPENEPFGALGDLGWYPVRASLFAMNFELPERVMGVARRDAKMNNAIVHFTGVMFFRGGRVASFDSGFDVGIRQWFEIGCPEGSVRVPDFVVPYATDSRNYFERVEYSDTLDFTVQAKLDSITKTVKVPACVQEERMMEEFCHGCLAMQKGQTQKAQEYASNTVATQRVIDALFKSATREGAIVNVVME